MRGSATAARSATGSRRTSAASASSTPRACSRSHGSAPPSRSPPASPPLPTTASRGPRRSLPTSSGCARSSTSRCSAGRRGRGAVRRACGPPSARRSSCGSASRRTRPTPARSTPTAGASRSESPSGRTSPRATVRTSGSSTASGPLSAARDVLVEPTGKRAVATLADVLCPELLSAHCVTVDPDEIGVLAGADVPVAHCPARTPCSDAAPRRSRRCARPGSASGSARTRPPRRRRSTRGRRCAPPSAPRRARERRPDALDAASALHLATLGGAAALGLEERAREHHTRQTRRHHRRLTCRKPVPSH